MIPLNFWYINMFNWSEGLKRLNIGYYFTHYKIYSPYCKIIFMLQTSYE